MVANVSRGIRVIGRRSIQRVGLSVVGNRRATSTASGEATLLLRRVTRSGLLVTAPISAAWRLSEPPPNAGSGTPAGPPAGGRPAVGSAGASAGVPPA